ncbi:MAG: cytochrome c biogenesis heme-transporting ATPase CcmA [Gammaproteobacteria bacterium]|nr:MAG: cytochrome c biogenesis heme-transporting ATPase CcmA [Gammaproteobacteria bacterium]
MSTHLQPLVTATDLEFFRDDISVFGRLSFELEAGSMVLVEGANGSGKTTLLRMLAGFIQPGAGQMEWDPEFEHNLQTAYLGHYLGIKDELTALENLVFLQRLAGYRTGPDCKAVLKDLELGDFEDATAGQLSAGQRKRVALGGLLAAPRQLWLLDEPFAALDRAGIAQVERLISEHLDNSGSVVMSTHGALGVHLERLQHINLS